DFHVTGVQTCALPISGCDRLRHLESLPARRARAGASRRALPPRAERVARPGVPAGATPGPPALHRGRDGGRPRPVRIVAGRWRGRQLSTPRGRDVRPTTDRVREAWMSAAQPSLPDARVLDLFAGSGALGLEALSRGAAEAVFVERARPALHALRANIDLLGAGAEARVVSDDVFRYLARDLPTFDVAFADPPYATGDASQLVTRFL